MAIRLKPNDRRTTAEGRTDADVGGKGERRREGDTGARTEAEREGGRTMRTNANAKEVDRENESGAWRVRVRPLVFHPVCDSL